MPHEINYSSLPAEEKRQTALNDLREWLGDEPFRIIAAEIQQMPKTKEAARSASFQLEMFAGVSGYPVAAWIASLWNLTDDEVVDMLLLKAETEVVEKCLS